MKLKGAVAIVTGAGRGFGRATAIEFAREGACVAIISRSKNELERTADTIRAENGTVLCFPGDVSSVHDIRALARETTRRLGPVDILMNNAAIAGPIGPVSGIPVREWDKTLRINLTGAMLCARAVIPQMVRRKKGKIIHVTSGLGESAVPCLAAYSVAKAGLIHLTRILAEELKNHNIQVNGLDPGEMDTPMQDGMRSLGPEILGEALFDRFSSMKEEGMLRRPEDVARLAVFLASRESDSLHGENGTEAHYRRFGYRD